jgi:NIMA (never in mitosis gene a)-related kinase 1/4/5
VIAYKEAFYEEGCLCVVMEYAELGDLQQRIELMRKTTQLMQETDIWGVAVKALKALKALHRMKIVHRDIKAANIFICAGNEVKLGDLNVSKIAKMGLMQTQTGTPYYASPEVWRDQPYDYKCDIWSLGCVLYELAALRPPFMAKDMKGLF